MSDLKKYTQISFFLLFFATLIVIKHYIGSDDDQLAVVAPNTVSPSPLPTSISTTAIPIPTTETIPGTSTPVATIVPTETPRGQYKDGLYAGSVEDAYYGNYQVQAVISGGRLTDVVFIQYPNDNRTSARINSQASVYLKEEAISAQSANVDIVSGASDSSIAFRKSIASALSQAKR